MEADNLSLTRKERRAKANREASLKKPIINPEITTSPFDFIFFTWFGPILRLVSLSFRCVTCLVNRTQHSMKATVRCRDSKGPSSTPTCLRCLPQSRLRIAIQNSEIAGIAFSQTRNALRRWVTGTTLTSQQQIAGCIKTFPAGSRIAEKN